MANAEALLELVDVIDKERENNLWNQGSWARQTQCGTSHCAAGWKATIDGHEFVFNPNMTVAGKLDTGEYVATYAQRTLDLTDEEAMFLFHVIDNDFEELVTGVRHIIDGDVNQEFIDDYEMSKIEAEGDIV